MFDPIQTYLERNGLDIAVKVTFPDREDVGTHEPCWEPCVGEVTVTANVYDKCRNVLFRAGQTLEPTLDEIHMFKTLCMTRERASAEMMEASWEQNEIVYFDDVQKMPDYERAEAA